MLIEFDHKDIDRNIDVSLMPWRAHSWLTRKFVFINSENITAMMVVGDASRYRILYPSSDAAFYNRYGFIWPNKWSTLGMMDYDKETKQLIFLEASQVRNVPLATMRSGLDMVEAVVVSLSGNGLPIRLYKPADGGFNDALALLEKDIYDRMQIRMRFSTFRKEKVPRYTDLRKKSISHNQDMLALTKVFSVKAGFDHRNVEVYIPQKSRWLRLCDITQRFETPIGTRKPYWHLTMEALRTD